MIKMINIISKIMLVMMIIIGAMCFKFQFNKFVQENPQIKQTQNSNTKIFFPLPKIISSNPQASPLSISPCEIDYKIVANPSINIQRIINQYLIDVFKCTETKPGKTSLLITIKDPSIMTSEKVQQQKYQLSITQKNSWTLIADTHVGFLRGFQTFSQIFEEDLNKQNSYVVNNIPITIQDQPDYLWRGVMLDTSRHFYPVDTILHLIDGLLYNKMSILHWHIIDQDSFPMHVPNNPQLSESGSIGGVYQKSDLLTVINYAKVRGVRVIPEFDTPAHTESWGRSQKNQDIIVKCNNQYEGQFDPTLNKTYQIVLNVSDYINSTFTDNYVHFGGDQIEQDCWENKPSIYQWMKDHNIQTFKQLQIYYRQQQKKLWREKVSTSKKAIYWANQQINLPVEDDDVIQWWGQSKNVDKLIGKKNQVILSNYDLTYLDVGFGGRDGTGYGTFITWRQVYSFNPKIANVNILGGQTCMWSQIANKNNLDQKVWIRSSALAERLWNVDVDINKALLNISQRLIAQGRRLKSRGFKPSPVTVGLCQKDPSICFK